MNRSFFWLFLALVCGPICSAQWVLYASQQIQQPDQGPAIRSIRPHTPLSSTLTVNYADGRKQTIAKDSIWGYEDRRGRLYRYYKRAFYRVVSVDDLVRYVITRPAGRGIANTRYFSQDYDSPLRWNKAKARRDSSVVQ